MGHVGALQVDLPELDLGDLELQVLEVGFDRRDLNAKHFYRTQVGRKLVQLMGAAFNESVPKILDGYVSYRGAVWIGTNQKRPFKKTLQKLSEARRFSWEVWLEVRTVGTSSHLRLFELRWKLRGKNNHLPRRSLFFYNYPTKVARYPHEWSLNGTLKGNKLKRCGDARRNPPRAHCRGRDLVNRMLQESLSQQPGCSWPVGLHD